MKPAISLPLLKALQPLSRNCCSIKYSLQHSLASGAPERFVAKKLLYQPYRQANCLPRLLFLHVHTS